MEDLSILGTSTLKREKLKSLTCFFLTSALLDTPQTLLIVNEPREGIAVDRVPGTLNRTRPAVPECGADPRALPGGQAALTVLARHVDAAGGGRDIALAAPAALGVRKTRVRGMAAALLRARRVPRKLTKKEI